MAAYREGVEGTVLAKFSRESFIHLVQDSANIPDITRPRRPISIFRVGKVLFCRKYIT